MGRESGGCFNLQLGSELVLRGWLIERGIFIIIISAFLLGVKADLFCVVGLIIFPCDMAGYRAIPMVHRYQWYDWYQ